MTSLRMKEVKLSNPMTETKEASSAVGIGNRIQIKLPIETHDSNWRQHD